MKRACSVFNKIAFLAMGAVFCCFLIASDVAAADFAGLQPAENATYNERIRVNSAISVARSSYFYGGVHIGETGGNGGVTFINGSIINASNGTVPVTFGDDVRIDGSLWRGPNVGPGDGLPVNVRDDLRVDGAIWGGPSKGNAVDRQSVVFADSIRPAADNINVFGSPGYRWASGNFAGTVTVGDLGGDNVVSENNINATNSPQAGYVLTYASDGQFVWAQASIDSTTGVFSDDDWVGSGSGAMFAANTSDNVGIGISSGATAKLQVVSSAPSNAVVYSGSSGVNSVALQGVATGAGSVGSYGSGVAYGGDFSASGGTGIAVRGQATSASGTNYGGYFTSGSSTGYGLKATGGAYGGDFSATGASGVGVRGQSTTGTGIYGSGLAYGGNFLSSSIGVRGYVTSTGATTSYGMLAASIDTGEAIKSFSGTNHGGLFYTNYASGVGMRGSSDASDSTGVYGDGTKYGVYGHGDIEVGAAYGGYFLSSSSAGIGVYGSGPAYGGQFASAAGIGVSGAGATQGGYFTASEAGSSGVYGSAIAASGANIGGDFSASFGKGVEASGTTYGGDFAASAGIGVEGDGTTHGGYFRTSTSDAIGVYGVSNTGTGAEGVYGASSSGSGVKGTSEAGYGVDGSSATGRGVYGSVSDASGYSGYFDGGNFYVELDTPGTNNFRIADSTGAAPGLATGTPADDVQVDTDGDLIQVVSSRRFKDNIQNLPIDVGKVLQIQPVSFTYKEGGSEDIGLIAEDVNELLPELVTYDQEDKPYSVKYDRLSVYNLGVIKEQQATIENQENRIEQLENIICKYLPREETCGDN